MLFYISFKEINQQRINIWSDWNNNHIKNWHKKFLWAQMRNKLRMQTLSSSQRQWQLQCTFVCIFVCANSMAAIWPHDLQLANNNKCRLLNDTDKTEGNWLMKTMVYVRKADAIDSLKKNTRSQKWSKNLINCNEMCTSLPGVHGKKYYNVNGRRKICCVELNQIANRYNIGDILRAGANLQRQNCLLLPYQCQFPFIRI